MTYTDWQRRDHIREIQEYLRVLAWVDNNYNELAVDGIYGKETTDAVRQFQIMNNLDVTGTVDPVTWEALVNAHLDALTLFTDAVAVQPFTDSQFVLKQGDSGDEVIILQAILNSITEITIVATGEYDAATTARVLDAQRLTGFPETGEVDRRFWDHLATLYNNRRR